MAKVQLGSKHGRPAFEVEATITAHPKVDKELASKAGFWGNGKAPTFSWSRFVPFVASGGSNGVGGKLSKDDAIKNFAQFIDSLDAVAKSDGIVVKDAKGDTLADEVVNPMPGALTGETAGSYVLRMVQYAYTLAHQNDLRSAHSDEILTAADKAKVLKVAGERASTGRVSRDSRVI